MALNGGLNPKQKRAKKTTARERGFFRIIKDSFGRRCRKNRNLFFRFFIAPELKNTPNLRREKKHKLTESIFSLIEQNLSGCILQICQKGSD